MIASKNKGGQTNQDNKNNTQKRPTQKHWLKDRLEYSIF